MFNTIFKKQFFFTVFLVAVSFLIMSFVLSRVFESYFTTQQIQMMEIQASRIAALFGETYSGSILTGVTTLREINKELQTLHDYLSASLILINTDYIVTTATSDIYLDVYGVSIRLEDLEPLMSGEPVSLNGRLGNIFSVPVLTVGYPVKFGGTVMGAVLLNASIPELDKTISEVFRITFVCILITLAISFLFVYFSSLNITKPIMQMNEVAKIIANGNFEKRIEVQSKDEVGQLATSFNHMAASLESQERLRQEFISNLSHDLRSPLTSMRGFLQAIIDGTIPQERHEYYIKVVLEESERLSKLANDVLDSSKLQEESINLIKEKIDINETIIRSALRFEARVAEKNLDMSINLVEDKVYVCVDTEKIQRVLHNLIDNAIKFTNDGGKICIENTLSAGKIYISITDTGKGIAPEEQKRVFDRFYKVDASRGEDKKGSGLGLSIVKDFVKAHGETITLSSELNVGSTFTFCLETV